MPRVLVIGEAAADTLCDTVQRGCWGGSAFRAAPAHPDPVEVVVAPTIHTEEAGRAVADCACRALPAGGRLVLRAVGQGAAELACGIAGHLRSYGSERLHLRGQAGGALVFCRLSGLQRVRETPLRLAFLRHQGDACYHLPFERRSQAWVVSEAEDLRGRSGTTCLHLLANPIAAGARSS